MKTHWSLVLMVCAGLPAGCKKAEQVPEAQVAVQAEHPTIASISEEIAADAVLSPLAQAAIEPRISAPILSESVQRGSRVHKGELLVRLEDRDLRGTALDSEGSLTQAQAAYTAATLATIPEDVQKAELDVAQAKANLDVANRTFEERNRLLDEGAIARRDVETARASAVQAQAAHDSAAKHLADVQKTTQQTSIDSAQGQLASAKGKLQNAQAQVSFANLQSPIDGVVTDRPYYQGETAPAGSPVVTVMDTSSLLAKVHIAQSAAQKLKMGGTAELTIPGEQEPQKATIALISPALDPGSTTVEVWLKLPNPDARFKVGTPVHAIMQGKTIPNALQIPVSAVVRADNGGSIVMLVGSDAAAHKREVRLGLRTSEKAQVLSGVAATDMVITQGGYGLDEGTKVKIGGSEDENKVGKDTGEQK